MNKEAILAELNKRRAARKLAEAKLETKKPARKPVVNSLLESTRKARNAKVISETKNRPFGNTQPRTISEAIALRTKGFTGEKQALYQTLSENIARAAKTVVEATQAGGWTTSAVGNAAGVGLVKTYFDIFYGYFPSLIVPEIASTQPIKTQKAMIFFYQSVAGSDKGKVKKGDVLIDAFEVNTDVDYTSNTIEIAAGVATPVWAPVLNRSVRIFEGHTALEVAYSDDVTFAAVDKDIQGAIVLDGTHITVTLTGTDAADVTAIKYAYGNAYAPTQVPELNANIKEMEITAKARTIKTNYSFQAGFGFEAQFGAKLEDKLAESAMYELKRETDLDFVFEIMNAAPVKVVWNKAAGVANGLYEFHKLSFVDAVAGAANYIFKRSKRKAGNVLLVGINAQTIVQTLPNFKGDAWGSSLEGSKVIGKLGEMKVIAIPELGENDWAVIYRSATDNLDAGIVFAPYIPVVATPTVMLDDLLARKAFTTSYGKLVVNPHYFVRGEIINNPVAQPVYLISKDGTDASLGQIGVDAFFPVAP